MSECPCNLCKQQTKEQQYQARIAELEAEVARLKRSFQEQYDESERGIFTAPERPHRSIEVTLRRVGKDSAFTWPEGVE